ncbi:MAG TPA: penicillin acylase family protein [Vicinamibacterales bacterium]|nr:penicillin acylase family protein [Vicinamibacterales bacterium]
MRITDTSLLARAVCFLSIAACGWSLAGRQAALDGLAKAALATIDGQIAVPGLRADVQVVRDRWGIPHIYASSEEDLFLAQGYVAAQDRLWQMEMWRRSGEGRLAEVLGPQALPRDRMARLLKYRGRADEEELSTYHPRARILMAAFVNGVNAFIEQHAARLPVEFVLTGIKPEPWTIETLILRQIAFGDATSELQLARSVAQLGPEEANRRRNPDPWDDLRVPDGLDVGIIGEEVLASTRAGGRPPRPEILPAFRGAASGGDQPVENIVREPGSNNWVVNAAFSATGKPVVANDPHREVTLPSLRYITHLNAPGWNVIGASEPPFLGVAIGHNERLGWGLTIVGTDQHDVYVEELNPANPNEVRWQDGFEPLRVVHERIPVKGRQPETVELKFSRHGPVFHEDRARLRAYALRSALLERGGAPYLAGLRLSQTADCREFLQAAMHWHAPSENLICGDVNGNISWLAAALTPSRKGWSGRLPVPGTGAYEWQGFRRDMPRELNPARGFVVTANHNIQPADYSPPIMFKTAGAQFDRITRLRQLLVPGRTYTLQDHRRMQLDAYSLRAAADLDRFRGWTAGSAEVERARALLAGWDAVYARDSTAAALYQTWREAAPPRAAPETDRPGIEASLGQAIKRLTAAQGTDWTAWRWGRMHARAFPHPFVRDFDLRAVERPGGAGTVAADGASYREILDVADWDRSIATNTPGQSGQPGSPFYDNLLPLWADDQYFPLAFSKKAVDGYAVHRLTLKGGSLEF